ncbi:endoglucanase 2-like [Hordeum vulgare subsp. vulgare]|uniref:Endoglucanase n=1 Tax=Hordeum vulgare subsp. vulgare TaxID=112509 RepID=A0A8I6WQI3_HORVV|nr:endoglucanase 2-like [Hordeum vulgare subsp. vulgare]
MGVVVVVVLAAMVQVAYCGGGGTTPNYREALAKSILFLEAQRSGVLPASQRVSWRSNSGLLDGKANGVDLTGGYYDAGDNVKFGLPMAFTVTMMAWSVLEYGGQMEAAGELGNALEAVKWGTDYFVKAHPEAKVLYGEVGDGDTDHGCWQRPEDMSTSRQAYRLDPQRPGSDLAGETAAAMAAASLVFRRSNPGYANQLLQHSKQLFDFADKYRGRYDASIPVARNFYQSVSGYSDELLWAAAWLFQATDDRRYLDYVANNADAMGGTGWSTGMFSWDIKYPGVQVLAAKILLHGKAGAHAAVLQRYRQKADFFVCASLGKQGSGNVKRTPGGLLHHQKWNNLQFVTSGSFLLAAYSDSLAAAGQAGVRCPAGAASPAEIMAFAKSQVDYILGSNPRGTSYMVGYGFIYPLEAHHRGASIVSVKSNPAFVSCRGGYATWYPRKGSNPNLLDGAIVGGPDEYDNFADERNNYEQTEATTYNNAPFMGVLARLAAGQGGGGRFDRSGLDNQTSLVPSLSAAADQAEHKSPIVIEQNATASWTEKGRTYRRYAVTVTNRSLNKTVHELYLGIASLYGPVTGLDKTRYGHVLPGTAPSVPAGGSVTFEYAHAAPPANVWVTGYKLV